MNINRQNKIRHERVFIAALISFGIVFVYIWLICFGNEPQTYTDIVIEFTSMDDSNKSTERTLVWILSLIGAAASFVFYSVWNRPHENSLRTSAGEKGDETPVSTPLGIIGNAIKRHLPAAASGKIILTVILAVSVTHLLVYTGKSPTLTMYFLFCITAVAVNRERLLSGTVFLTYSLYALCGLYRLTVLFGCDERLRLIYTAAIPLALAIALLLLSQYRKKDYFVKGILAAQTVIPFLLLLFLSSRYLYRGVMTEIHVPARISLLIWLVIAVFAAQAVRKITKHWRGNAGINDVITFGTICCIMNYNRYSGSGVIMPDDPHHPFENIIAYSQTVELGQKLFSEYIPVSGLFSFVQGFFLSFFGKGEYANYNVTENLFYFAVICATVFLLMKHVRPTTALLTARYMKTPPGLTGLS